MCFHNQTGATLYLQNLGSYLVKIWGIILMIEYTNDLNRFISCPNSIE